VSQVGNALFPHYPDVFHCGLGIFVPEPFAIRAVTHSDLYLALGLSHMGLRRACGRRGKPVTRQNKKVSLISMSLLQGAGFGIVKRDYSRYLGWTGFRPAHLPVKHSPCAHIGGHSGNPLRSYFTGLNASTLTSVRRRRMRRLRCGAHEIRRELLQGVLICLTRGAYYCHSSVALPSRESREAIDRFHYPRNQIGR